MTQEGVGPVADADTAGLRATRAIIDLDAIAENVRAMRGALPVRTALMAVVKADGYGHGAPWVAKAAVEAGASALGVATVSEGKTLRRHGLDVPIILLGAIDPSEAWAACEAMGQKPVKTQDTPGFVLNYFLIPFNNDAIRLVEQGVAEAADIDLAIKTGMGYAMGPMELLDLVGMDTQKLLCEAMHGITNEPRAACPPLVKRMIAAGWLGKKSGRGFHTYADRKMYGA